MVEATRNLDTAETLFIVYSKTFHNAKKTRHEPVTTSLAVPQARLRRRA
jgi:hypothetical protein